MSVEDEVAIVARKAPDGVCAICGQYGKLSYEHVPPEAAFNSDPVWISTFDAFFDKMPGEKPDRAGTRQEQRGAGGYTLCESCNNRTGAWYGNAYVRWCQQAMELLIKTGGRPTLSYPFTIFPLPVIKQIMAIFCSINAPRLAANDPELAAFLLDPSKRFLNPKYSVYAYLTWEGRTRRRTGLTAIASLVGGSPKLISEFSHPPFGYVLGLDSATPDSRLVDLTYFARYGRFDLETLYLSLPVLTTHLWIPRDYRSVKEIQEQAARSRIEAAEFAQRHGWKPDGS